MENHHFFFCNGVCSSVLTISDDDGSLGVTSLAITSTPNSGSTYQLDEVIQFTVTLSGVVTVDTTGTPYFSFSMGDDPRNAIYASGSGSKLLVFSYTVVAGDNDGDGLSWGANSFSLNGGGGESVLSRSVLEIFLIM